MIEFYKSHNIDLNAVAKLGRTKYGLSSLNVQAGAKVLYENIQGGLELDPISFVSMILLSDSFVLARPLI